MELRARPAWLDQDEYPFRSNFFETSDGAMHYVDEGEGESSCSSTAIRRGRSCTRT
jgi:hypothetical protein